MEKVCASVFSSPCTGKIFLKRFTTRKCLNELHRYGNTGKQKSHFFAKLDQFNNFFVHKIMRKQIKFSTAHTTRFTCFRVLKIKILSNLKL